MTTTTTTTTTTAASSSSPSLSQSPSSVRCHLLWDLPDVVLFHIVSFTAGPTRRAAVLCHQLAPTCHAARRGLLLDDGAAALWEKVLKEDYGRTAASSGDDTIHNTEEQRPGRKRRAAAGQPPPRRSCKRLRKSVVQQVQSAHQLIKDNTEIAYFYISELCSGNNGSSSKPKSSQLTKTKLDQILHEYGPHLRINERTASGGVLLVEVCRAQRTTEHHILNCVKLLVHEYGARPHVQTDESNNRNCRLTALCVAAVRGMSKVVAYLLKRESTTTQSSQGQPTQYQQQHQIPSSGRFRLYTQGRSGTSGERNRRTNLSLRCNDATPLEFATAMRQAEIDAGAAPRDLKGLNQCIQQLSKLEQDTIGSDGAKKNNALTTRNQDDDGVGGDEDSCQKKPAAAKSKRRRRRR